LALSRTYFTSAIGLGINQSQIKVNIQKKWKIKMCKVILLLTKNSDLFREKAFKKCPKAFSNNNEEIVQLASR